MYKVVRRGPSRITTIIDKHSESTFHEIDNLDTKEVPEAQDNYEKVFIIVRKFLEENEQFCCDDKEDRLSLSQGIADSLKKALLIKRSNP